MTTKRRIAAANYSYGWRGGATGPFHGYYGRVISATRRKGCAGREPIPGDNSPHNQWIDASLPAAGF